MDELVRNFAEGQVSRRVFIRRLVAAGATLAGATTVANLIQADPAGAAVSCDGSVTMFADYSLSPVTLTLPSLGGAVCWTWESGAPFHSVTDTTGLGLYDSSPTPNGWGGYDDWVNTSYLLEFSAAGTWTYYCKDLNHPPLPTSGTVKVPMSLSKSSTRVGGRVLVSWAQAAPPGVDLVFDVEVRRPGQGWQSWKEGVTGNSSNIRAKEGGRYRFRARVRNKVTGESCGWSPIASFTAK